MVTLPGGTFFGTERARRRVAGLLLTETTHRAGEELPPHEHERAYFCCVVRGGFTERDGRATRECGPAAVIFHPPDAGHSDRFGDESSRCVNLELDPIWLDRMTEGGRDVPRESRLFRRQRINWIASHLLDEFRASDPSGDLAIEGLALALVAGVARVDSRSRESAPGWIDRVVEALHAASPARIPGLAELADEAGVHPVHLARVFRRHHGCSVGEYARALRIERAAEMLRDSSQPIGRLAHRLGYADHSHFSRAFRRATGASPSEYRRRRGSAGSDAASGVQDRSGSDR